MRPQPGLGFTAPVAASGGPNYGPELWPQPAFAASTELTLARATVSGGALHFPGAATGVQLCRADSFSHAPITAGTYHCVITVGATGSEENLSVKVGGATHNISLTGPSYPLTYTFDIATSAVSQNIDINDAIGDLTVTVTAMSVTRVLP